MGAFVVYAQGLSLKIWSLVFWDSTTHRAEIIMRTLNWVWTTIKSSRKLMFYNKNVWCSPTTQKLKIGISNIQNMRYFKGIKGLSDKNCESMVRSLVAYFNNRFSNKILWMLNELQFCSHKAATHMPAASTVSMKKHDTTVDVSRKWFWSRD